jgi:uncharacterized metal-binding protein
MKYIMQDLYSILVKLLKIPKLFDKESELTSNIAVNKLISPAYFLIIFYYLFFFKNIPLVLSGHWILGSLSLSFLSTFFYIWCSYFFQPDLDVRTNRPGLNTFPVGAILLNSKFSFFLIPVQFVLGKAWYYFWQPYASLCTHRGVSHWPLISVFFRSSYILFWILIVKFIFGLINIHNLPILPTVEYWAESFFPTAKGFGSITWFCFCFPVFISDLAHEFIDALDSRRKKISFCPPQLPRGLVAHGFLFLKGLLAKKPSKF